MRQPATNGLSEINMDTLFLGLVLVFLVLVVRIFRMIYQTYRCPEEQLLRDFWYGRLENRPEVRRRVVSHLGHCEECRDRLHRIQKGLPLEEHLVE